MRFTNVHLAFSLANVVKRHITFRIFHLGDSAFSHHLVSGKYMPSPHEPKELLHNDLLVAFCRS